MAKSRGRACTAIFYSATLFRLASLTAVIGEARGSRLGLARALSAPSHADNSRRPANLGSPSETRVAPGSIGVRSRLAAGGRWIRTSGSAREEIKKSRYPVGVQLILFMGPSPGSQPSHPVATPASNTAPANEGTSCQRLGLPSARRDPPMSVKVRVAVARAFSEMQAPTGPGGVERGPLRGTGDFPRR